MERELVSRQNVDFVAIEAGALHGVDWRKQLRGVVRLARGLWQAWRQLRQFKPQVVLLTGGFVGVPVSVAAWLRRVPALVYLPDIEPGLALKVMARLAHKVATTTEASTAFLPPHKMVVTGYPVRDVFLNASQARGRARFNIGQNEKVLLVFGGSKGARNINRAVLAQVQQLLQRCVVIHVAGAEDWDEVRAAHAQLPEMAQRRYLVFKYLHEEMADAMAAADVAVCRAGASALGELTLLGLPAVLVPYPYAWRFQKVNAAYLAERGAAVVLPDEKLHEELVHTVTVLLEDDAKRATMRAQSLQLGRRDGAQRIADELLALAR
jgi:UDP-N-acetylglucosamine--N-acetylmuramyl-(pentapeptide) pyrophosphoryl-undecaprenol N-acetylglucosamine transferase